MLSASVILSIVLTATSIGSNYIRPSQSPLFIYRIHEGHPCSRTSAQFPSQFTALSLVNLIPESEPPGAFDTRCYASTLYRLCVELRVTLWCELIGQSARAEIDGPTFRGGKRLTSACNEWADNLSFNLWADGKAWLRPPFSSTHSRSPHTHAGDVRDRQPPHTTHHTLNHSYLSHTTLSTSLPQDVTRRKCPRNPEDPVSPTRDSLPPWIHLPRLPYASGYPPSGKTSSSWPSWVASP